MYGTVKHVTRDNGDTPQPVNQLPTRLVCDYKSTQPETGVVINVGVQQGQGHSKTSLRLHAICKQTHVVHLLPTIIFFFCVRVVPYILRRETGEGKGTVAP